MAFVIESDPGRALRFRLEGAEAVPKTPRWRNATPRQRARYWPIFAGILLESWRGQMLAGRGRRGHIRRARPISRIPYAESGLESAGPGLLPQRERSRAYRLARVTPYADLGRVTGFFAGGFGRVLSYHHEGLAGRGRAYRDEAGRLRFAGIRGAVTGIVRDLMPTQATIAAAVEAAEAEWWRAARPSPRRGTPPAAIAAPPLRPPLKSEPDRTYPDRDHRSLSLDWRQGQRARGQGYRTVLVDVAAFDAAWQGDEGYAIPRGGGGAEITGRRRDFLRWMIRQVEAGAGLADAIHAAEVTSGVSRYRPEPGPPSIEDGRHRFSVLRDLGIAYLPVTAEASDAARVASRFGYRGLPAEGEPRAPSRAAILARLRRLLEVEERRAAVRRGSRGRDGA